MRIRVFKSGTLRHQNCWMSFLKCVNKVSASRDTQRREVLFFLWTCYHIFFCWKYHFSNINVLLSVASLSFPSSIKAQTASSRPAVCLEPRLCRVQTAERSGSTPPLSLPPLSSLQLGAIILLLCVCVMGKGPTSPLERNWQTIIWGGEELRHIVGRLHKPPQRVCEGA